MANNFLFTKDITFAVSGTLSSTLSLDGLFAIVGIILPAAWTAGNITVEASMDERNATDSTWTPTTWYGIYDSTGTQYTITAGAASRGLMLSQDILMAGKHFRFTCTVAQAAARTVTMIFRAVG